MRAETIGLDPEVETLLAQAQLPVADLAGSRRLTLLGMREAGPLIGVIGVEDHGDVGMLRSLAVLPDHRNTGLGAILADCAEAWALEHGIRCLYLLTTTAERFFARRGYVSVARADAPKSISESVQFAGLCPASSAFMCKALTGQAQR